MTKELRELLNKIHTKKDDGMKLIEAGKIEDAEKIAEEVQALEREFDVKMKLFNDQKDNVPDMPVQGENGPINNNGVRIFAKGQPLTKNFKNEKGLNLGKYVRGALTANWNGAEAEMEEFRAMSTSTGAVVIPTVLGAEIIDLARNKSVILGGGVPLVEMTSNNLTLAKIAEYPQFGFKTELATATPSDMSFEPVTLNSKTCYGLMKISLETLHSAMNLDTIVRDAMSNSIAQTIDKACLFGDATDGKSPKGILTYDTINAVDATGLTNFLPYVKAVSKIRQANGEPTAWVMNAITDEKLNSLADTTGQPLNMPKVLEGLNRMVSNQLPSDLGTNDDESISMIFDPLAIALGMQVKITIEVSREKGFEDGSVWFRVYSMLDVAPIQPKHITKVTAIK